MVRIITDSAADFEPTELEQMNISCIPLSVYFENTEYQENIDLTKDQFYRYLIQKNSFPHTSQPSPQIFADQIQSAKESGDGVVIITISSGLSRTYQGAVLAKNITEYENCYIIDSLNGTGGERMLVEYAVKLRDMGKNAREIVSAVENLRSRVVLYACMDTLEYLHRGGRISHTTYTIGSFAHIKPILHVDKEGRAEIPAKTLGLRKGMDYMCRKLETIPPDEDFPLYVMFTYDRSNGEKLADRIRGMGYTIPDNRIIPVGAAIGTHIGPNACGIVYIAKETNCGK